MKTRRPGPSTTDVAQRIHSAAIRLLRRLRREDAAMGVTAARASTLSVVVFAGPVTLGRLAQAEQVSAPTMTRLIVGMEEEGLVKREADSSDRRVVWIRPTAKGTRLLTEGRQRRVDALARDLAALGPADLSVLSRAADILDGIGRADDADRSAGRPRRGRRRFA